MSAAEVSGVHPTPLRPIEVALAFGEMRWPREAMILAMSFEPHAPDLTAREWTRVLDVFAAEAAS